MVKVTYTTHSKVVVLKNGVIVCRWLLLESPPSFLNFSLLHFFTFSLLIGGTTVHSAFCIPANANLSDAYLPQIGPLTVRYAALRTAQIIIIDEVTMMHRFLLSAIDNALRWIRKVNVPFGGVILLLGGDWKQLLPVVRGVPRDCTLYAQLEACIQNHRLYDQFQHIVLKENMRARKDAAFVDFLERVGNSLSTLTVRIFSLAVVLK